MNARTVEKRNAHLSGKFRGDAGKPAVAQLLHLKKKNTALWPKLGADPKCTLVYTKQDFSRQWCKQRFAVKDCLCDDSMELQV